MPDALADAITTLLHLPADERQAFGAAARQRITDEFEIGAIAGRYLALYRATLAQKAG